MSEHLTIHLPPPEDVARRGNPATGIPDYGYLFGLYKKAYTQLLATMQREAKLKNAIQMWCDADSHEADEVAATALINALKSCEYSNTTKEKGNL